MKPIFAYALATAVGVLLFAAPFLRYGAGGAHAHAAHSDHGARHGGHLFMLGDDHLELVEHEDHVELFVGDAKRRPIRPGWCSAVFEDGQELPCTWESYRSVAHGSTNGRSVRYEIGVSAGVEIRFKYP